MRTGKSVHEFFPVLQWRPAFDPEKLFVEIGHCVIAAFVTNVHYGFLCFEQQGACIANADLVKKINIGFLRALFEVVAEGRNAHAGDGGDPGQGNGLSEGIDGELEYPVDAGCIPGIVRCGVLGRQREEGSLLGDQVEAFTQ